MVTKKRGSLMKRTLLVLATLVVAGWAATGFAQGTQTGTIRGTVSSQDGNALPGVTVTITSPVLQGQRTTVSDADGHFTFSALPPGAYQVQFDLSGFQTSKVNA